jgi:hypothetical protein
MINSAEVKEFFFRIEGSPLFPLLERKYRVFVTTKEAKEKKDPTKDPNHLP